MNPFRWFRRPSEVRVLVLALQGAIATGVSSRALLLDALGIKTIDQERPWDSGDFLRCAQTYEQCPRHLQRRMRPHMEAWAAQLYGEGHNIHWANPEWLRDQGLPRTRAERLYLDPFDDAPEDEREEQDL